MSKNSSASQSEASRLKEILLGVKDLLEKLESSENIKLSLDVKKEPWHFEFSFFTNSREFIHCAILERDSLLEEDGKNWLVELRQQLIAKVRS